MTQIQQQKAAKEFAERWKGKGYEKGESQIFWSTLLTEVFGVGHEVEYGKKKGDFKVDGTYTFEVGGRSKDFKQIAGVPNSYVLADDIDFPLGNKLPLWIVGFLY